jgi:hypothetical protein
VLNLFRDDDDPETKISPSEHRGTGLEAEFHEIVLDQLVRGGVDERCVSIDVRATGRADDGLPVYACTLRLHRWERVSALRLLLGLPLLQARVRKAIESSWVDDLGHFSGLWLHPSGQFEETSAMNDLRKMIVHMEQVMAPGDRRAPDSQDPSVWSVPLELMPPARAR